MDASAGERKTFSNGFRIFLRIVIVLSRGRGCGICVPAVSQRSGICAGRRRLRAGAVGAVLRRGVAPEGKAGVSGAVPEETALSIDFDALRQINPNVVGWILSEGTRSAIHVVQGEDNDYYLTHLFDESKTSWVPSLWIFAAAAISQIQTPCSTGTT
jgi:hypothetical protein